MSGYSKGATIEDSVFYVNDPFYNINYYPYSEVVKGEASIFHTIPSLKCISQQSTSVSPMTFL